jgi:ribosomal subunit interface protein
MTKRIVFRNMDHSQAMESFANEHLAKIEEFLQKDDKTPIKIDLIVESSKGHEHHKVELLVKSPKYDLVISREYPGKKFYDTLSEVIEIMYQELHKAKDKLVDKRQTGGTDRVIKKNESI